MALVVEGQPALRDQFVNSEIVPELFPRIITVALKNTIIYTTGAFVFGLLLGLVPGIVGLILTLS